MAVLKKILLVLSALLFLLLIMYYLGPVPEYDPVVDTKIELTAYTLEEVDSLVKNQRILPNQKPNNESLLFWADSIPKKTKYAILYLHGFSASPEEGNPVHINFARRYGFNAYIPLLAGHGLDSKESFADIEPNDWINAAKEALNIAQSIGEDVLLMSCSTGSTLSLYLASENKELIDVLLMYSPNISLENPTAKLITGPWGKELAYYVQGKYKSWREEGTPLSEKDKYWTHTYRTEGIISLQKLIDMTMTDDVLSRITQPYFLGYYYKNDSMKDMTVSIERMKEFNKISKTPEEEKQFVAFPNAGGHVMTSSIQSQTVDEVSEATYAYVESVLGLVPILK